MTIGDALVQGTQTLEASGNEEAAYEAAELLSFVLQCSRTELQVKRNSSVSEEQAKKFQELLQQRIDHYPLQYLLGEWDFYNRSFTVSEGVLIPRPETELLVDLALTYLNEHFPEEGRAAKVLDLCSGSGCVGIAVEQNFRNCRVVSFEKSEAACHIIRGNMSRNHTERMELVQGDLFDGPEVYGLLDFDLILANPPYLTEAEMATLQAELEHEPAMALYGGEDGLLFYRAIAGQWLSALVPGGYIAVEIGETQGESVSNLFAEQLETVTVRKDFAGQPRVVIGNRSFSLTI